ncbi:MAG: apolipoprotein N-acyltransferase [Gemmatimonadetes bacterium]|nr:MAG: apolipoprotein N-acyltransferase [Gemmatimonadota bacterium]
MRFRIETDRTFSLSKHQFFAILAGVIGALAFMPLAGVGVLIFVAFVPLLRVLDEIATDGRPKPLARTFRVTYLFGVFFNLGLLYWIAIVRPILIAGMVGAVAVLAGYYALMGVLAVWMRRRGFSLQLTVPFLWLGMDYWLNQTELAIPWGNLGYALTYFPTLLQFIAITGIIGATFWIMLVNVLLFDAQMAANYRKWGIHLSLIGVVIGTAWLHGVWTIQRGLPADTPHIRVGLVQPSYPMKLKWADEFEEFVINEQLEMSATLLPQHPDLILWAETSVPAHLYYKPLYRHKLAQFARDHRTPLFVGAPHTVFDENRRRFVYNAAFLFDEQGRMSPFYAKMRLVPFAERMPYQERFPFLQKYDLGQANFSKGTEFTIFETPKGKFGAGICYETVFPNLSREMLRHGADFLVTITNDTWFGPSPAPYQHANMHRMRCIENRVSLARCANSGVSLFADPFGRVLKKTPFYEVTTLVADIPLRTQTTFYTRYGDLLVQLGLIVLAGMLLTALIRKERSGETVGGY